jgi:5'-nucleotidase
MRRTWRRVVTTLAAIGLVAALAPMAAGADDGGVEAAATASTEGYRLVHANGVLEAFGDTGLADQAALAGHDDVVGAASTATGKGAYTASADGGVFAYGDAAFQGSAGNVDLNFPIVGIAANPGGGYWLVAEDGGIFAFGAAGFFGSTGAITLNQPIVGMAPTPTGKGYWLVAADGGVFSFGDATFFGSTGAITLNQPIVGIAATPTGKGYWIVASDGGIFAFGDAVFLGSTGAIALNSPIVGMSRTHDGTGYWLAAADGGIFSFGQAPFLGRSSDTNADSPVVGIAGVTDRFVDLQILSINDFHGNLEPPGGQITGQDVGGAAFLSTQLTNARTGHANSITVTAGDNIGASPLLSGLFHDEPTIESLNAMHVELAAVGNHEFDEGLTELKRMQNGGCAVTDPASPAPCQAHQFAGATFQYLAANVTDTGTGQTVFPATAVKTYQGVKVGFIGLTLKGTPDIVTPTAVQNLAFADEASTINGLVPQLQAQGARAIVVLIHQGGQQGAGGALNGCTNFSGELTPILNALDPAVQVVISGHTHNFYNCTIGNRLVTSASSFGRVFTDLNITIDRNSGDIVAKSATNKLVTRTVTADPAIQSIINTYKALAAPLQNQVVGRIAGQMTRTSLPSGESVLGDFIADSQLFDTRGQGADIAFMNPGGIRADLPSAAPGATPVDVTFGDIFTVQPFGNSLVTKDMTGAQIEAVLEQQIFTVPAGQTVPTRILQISDSLRYTWTTAAQSDGGHIDPATITIDDPDTPVADPTPINLAQTYRVTMNSFLATGGDGFTAFNQGTNAVGGDIDTDAVKKYFVSLTSPPSVVPAPTPNRITVTP